MIKQRALKIFIASALALIGASAATCEEGDQHPSAPRVPEVRPQPTDAQPGGGGCQQPCPKPGDPKPPTPSTSPSQQAMRNLQIVVIFDGERGMSVKITIAGQPSWEYPKGTKKLGNQAKYTRSAPVGSTVQIFSVPTLDKDRNFSQFAYVVTTDPEQNVCATDNVDKGSASCTGVVPKAK